MSNTKVYDEAVDKIYALEKQVKELEQQVHDKQAIIDTAYELVWDADFLNKDKVLDILDPPSEVSECTN